jgi:hypothetical protein
MAGIDSLVKSAVGSLAKDKVSGMLTPNQLELASFVMSPQYYLAEKGISKIADILGYGSDYKELQQGAKDEKAYGKEVARDTLGDMLPDVLGDFVRATPRSDEPYDPYNGYYSQDVNDWIETSNSTPEKLNAFENLVRDMNYGTQTPGQGKYVGPLSEDNPLFDAQVSNLPYDLKSTPISGAPEDFDPALLASIMRGDNANTADNSFVDDVGEMTIVGDRTPSSNLAPIDFGGMMDYGDVFGGGGGRGDDSYSYSNAMAKGGRVCSCHK